MNADLKEILSNEQIDALLLSSTSNIAYLTNYFGFSETEREAYIFVTKQKQYLLTDRRYIEEVRNIKNLTLVEITHEKPILKRIQELTRKHEIVSIGVEEADLRLKEYLALKKLRMKLKPLSLRTLRMHKSSEEVAKIAKACEIADKALASVQKQLKKSMTEREIALLLETEIKKQGADVSFSPIVAFNENAAVPHHLSSDQHLKKNSLILIDFGAKYSGYCSDMTRTFSFGNPTDEQKRVYQIVLEAQEKAVEYVNNRTMKQFNNGVLAAHIDKAARSFIEQQGYPTIPHSLGHGIGIQVHEAPSLSPRSNDELTDGMVFSIEPGIYLPGDFGIRIEDLFAIQNGKLVQLTRSPSKLLVL